MEPLAPTDVRDRDVAERVSTGSSLSGHAARGFAWTVGARLVAQVAQFASSVVLARLLAPSAYGLVTITWTFTAFAALFNDLGLTAALVQSRRMTERDASTAFAINLLAGVVLCGATLGLRVPLADLFHQPKLAGLLALGSLSFLLSLTVVPFAILERTMRFRTVAAIDVGSAVAGLGVSIACAAEGLGAASLVIGPVATTFLSTVAALLCARWVPRVLPSRASARQLFSFGGHLTSYNVIGFWSRNADNLLLGRFGGATELGLYNRAFTLMLLPLQQVGGVLGRVLLPLFASMKDDPERLRAAMTRLCAATAVLVFPTLLGLVAISHNFVLALYGPRWSGSIPLIMILAISGMPQIFGIASAQVCQAVGETRLLSTWGTVFSLSAVVAIVAGLPWGAEGVAIGLAIRGWVTIPLEMIPAKRTIGIGTRELIGATRLPLLAAVVMELVVAGVGVLLDRYVPVGVALAVQIPVGGVVFVGLLFALDRGAFSDTLILVRERRLSGA